MPVLTDEDKVIRNDVGKRIAAAIESLSAPEAEKVSYDNTESGMTADNAQDAIDELKSDIDSVELADLDDVNLTSPQDEDELHYDSSTSKWKNIAKKIYEKSSSGSLVSFNDGGDNIPLKSLIANITAVQSGSGAPAPDNVRTISGWSGINVSRVGKNLFDFTRFATEYPSYCSMNGDVLEVNSNGELYATGISVAFPTKTIYTSVKIKCGTAYNVRIRFIYSDGTTGETSGVTSTDTWTTVTAATASSKRVVSIRFNWTTSGTFEIKDFILSFESNPTYEPYNGTQITLPFGQIVYGGTLDVLSGVLTVTHGYLDLGILDYTYNSTGAFFANFYTPRKVYTRLISDIYEYIGYKSDTDMLSVENYKIADNAGQWLKIKNTNYTDPTAFKTAMSGHYIIYELATPVTYQLTPAQVSTLLGLNNIFADTGDISLSYFTQNANAINNIAESNTRTALNTDVPKTDLTDIFVTGAKNNTGSTITAGTYFYVNNQLALCKQAISANADLTLNTNYELVTAGALNKLMSNVNTSLGSKLNSANPTGTGALSLNRKSGTTTGTNSVAEGSTPTASGHSSHAEGYSTTASEIGSHSEGVSTTASGQASHAEGWGTIANHRSQHVFGEYNTADASTAAATARGNYIEIVGKGSGDANRSNARTLDWSGNETLAGDLTYKGNVSLASMLSTYSLSSTASITLANFRFSSAIILGYAQGIGDVAILVTAGSNVITSTIDLKTGTAFSSSHLTFSISNNTLTIASDNASVSTLTIIRGN